MAKFLDQQGDVLFHSEDKLPKGLKPVKNKRDGLVTFAEGEVTGHHHSAAVLEVEPGVKNIELYEDGKGTMWCKVVEATPVTHQEHGTVTLDPGVYRIGIVREYDPLAEEIRRVAD